MMKALCVDRVQSFRDRADFDNLNTHATSNLHADEKVTREIAYENHSIQYLVVAMTRTETEHSRV